jgi:hypothetical protein
VKPGTALFGCHDTDHIARDLEEIRAAGFEWVVLPMTEQDATYEIDTFEFAVTSARDQGLEPWISPWGVAGCFGGEGVTSGMTVSRWLDAALECRPATIMWDEPKIVEALLLGFMDHVRDAGVRNAVVVEPERRPLYDYALSAADSAGIDPYFDTVGQISETARSFVELKPNDPHVWVRAFRIAYGTEAFVGEAVAKLAKVPGIGRVGVWGWKGSNASGVLRSARPLVVQQEVNAAITQAAQ